ncbi:tetratricopeptide repeat protein, partial [Streptomyces europaeiscabiei]
NNLGVRYSEVGRRVDAVAPVEEAAGLYRALVEGNPAFVPDLAMALNNLGAFYSEVSRKAEDAWAAVLSDVDPRTAAFLLLIRASRAQAGDTDAVAWLATVAEIADDGYEILGVLHSAGRRHRAAAGPEAFDEVWREHTGAEPPAWLSVDADLVAAAQVWVETETYTAERDHLAAHPELLTPEADSAVDEVLLLVGQEAQRYRDIRQVAQNDSVESAYRPLLLTILAQEFAVADPPSQRRLLSERREDLLDDIVLDVLSRLVADSTPENTPTFTQAQALLQLAQLGEHGPALDALEDPSRFPELLQEHARRPDPAPLHPTAVLALTAATSAQLAATAVFHLAVATVLSGDTDQADQLLISAHGLLPEAGAAWINELADIAHHHRAALSLIPTLTRQPPADSPEEHDAPN